MKLIESTSHKLQMLIRDAEFKTDTRVLVLGYIERVVKDQEFRDRLKVAIESRLEDFIGYSLKEWLLLKVKNVWKDSFLEIADRMIHKLPDILTRCFEEMDMVFETLPQSIEEHKESIENILIKMQMGLLHEISIRSIVMEQLETVTAEDLEVAFREFSDDKLSFITILGGILGLIGGLVILSPIWSLLGITSLTLVLWLLDNFLYSLLRIRAKKREARLVVEQSACTRSAIASSLQAPDPKVRVAPEIGRELPK